jgi:hypothetical protein
MIEVKLQSFHHADKAKVKVDDLKERKADRKMRFLES